jgi:hypothetical protein
MKITITINTDNDAFHQDYNELENIFRDLAMQSNIGWLDGPVDKSIWDTNGNSVGRIVMVADSDAPDKLEEYKKRAVEGGHWTGAHVRQILADWEADREGGSL